MINGFFVPELEDVNVDDLWFKQDLMSYSQRNNKFNESNFWWAHFVTSWTCGVASKIVRFNTAGQFFVGLYEAACLCISPRRLVYTFLPKKLLICRNRRLRTTTYGIYLPYKLSHQNLDYDIFIRFYDIKNSSVKSIIASMQPRLTVMFSCLEYVWQIQRFLT